MMRSMLLASLTAAGEAAGGRYSGGAESYTDATFAMYGWISKLNHSGMYPGTKRSFGYNDAMPNVLRFVGHDFMSDFIVDGCLDTEHSENQGLEYALDVVYSCSADICRDDGHCGYDYSDFSILLAESMIDYQLGAYDPDGRGLMQTPFVGPAHCPSNGHSAPLWKSCLNVPGGLWWDTQLGRKSTPLRDCKTGSRAAMARAHPKPGGGGVPMGLADTLSFAEIHTVLGGGENGRSCHFTAVDVVAILGIHTIGQAKDHNTGFSGSWSDNGKFDNEYYRDYFSMGWKKKPNGMGWECMPGSHGVDLHSLNRQYPPMMGTPYYGRTAFERGTCWPGSLRLSADMILMYELDGSETECSWVPNERNPDQVQSSCKLRPTWVEMHKYALSDSDWLVAYRDAWKKMIDCNHHYIRGWSPEELASKGVVEVAERYYE